jgi:pimeloyl-ACP methyl ester carboxylesterase
LATAWKHPEISAVVLWASISSFDRWPSERQKKQWRKKGYMEATSKNAKPAMQLNTVLLDDIEQNIQGILNLEKAASELKRPLFIGHGEQDLTVRIEEGEKLYKWSDKNLSEFLRIPTAGHTFNVSHPFSGPNEKLNLLLEKSFLFLKKSLFS